MFGTDMRPLLTPDELAAREAEYQAELRQRAHHAQVLAKRVNADPILAALLQPLERTGMSYNDKYLFIEALEQAFERKRP